VTAHEDAQTFRIELSAWMDERAPRSLWHSVSTPFQGHWGGKNADFASEDHRRWFEVCLERGFTAPGWPERYGGAGLPPSHVRVFHEELRRRGLPQPVVGFGLTMIGPIVLAHGTDEQKAFHLSAIVRGELRWCQGYSEPGAGSDLASLTMKAELRDGHFVVSGQKIWTSHAEKADWIFCLVRTSSAGRKQEGITFLLIDMSSPGITVRPIQLISGASPFCEVYLDEVVVPADQVVGTVGDGWRVAKALLAHERAMVGESIAAGGARPEVLQGYGLARHALDVHGRDPAGRLDAPALRDAIAEVEMEEEAMRLLVRQLNEALKAGHQPGAESSILKIAGTELNQRRWELAVDIAGPDALTWDDTGMLEHDQALGRHFLRSRGNTIEGGTSEIQRNIVARRVLGLPKAR